MSGWGTVYIDGKPRTVSYTYYPQPYYPPLTPEQKEAKRKRKIEKRQQKAQRKKIKRQRKATKRQLKAEKKKIKRQQKNKLNIPMLFEKD
jgi:cytochrome c-type biogenesis protein CcmH/NrfG